MPKHPIIKCHGILGTKIAGELSPHANDVACSLDESKAVEKNNQRANLSMSTQEKGFYAFNLLRSSHLRTPSTEIRLISRLLEIEGEQGSSPFACSPRKCYGKVSVFESV
ncbi:MAG: hypothetical protein MUC83_08405 [Pirellula sp.]|jgi:hypothetical protein|nr:hypothetical protein [Pirellula sp.]